MSIVLNEYEWVEKAIRDRELGKKPSETLNRVAKYYLHNGYTKKETVGLLEDFILRCDPGNSVSKWTNTIDHVMKSASKYPLVMIDKVSVTAGEIEKIEQLKSRQAKRLAFTLLCIAKYMNTVRGSGYWVSTPDAEIMSMANINTSIKRQSLLFNQLREAGLIGFSKKIDNLSVNVLFVDDSSDEVAAVSDFRNLGYQYLKFCGESFFECQCCGITVKRKKGSKNNQKYCSSCAATVRMQQTVNSIMRQRGPMVDDCKYKIYMHILPDGKKYIGTTKKELCERWRNGRGYLSQPKFQAAIDQSGWNNIRHFLLFDNLDLQTSKIYEALLIKEHKTNYEKYGYNTHSGKYMCEVGTSTLPQCIVYTEVDGNGIINSRNT